MKADKTHDSARKSASGARKGPDARNPEPKSGLAMRSRNRSRQGFTLIELLAVLAIVGVLIGLLFTLSGVVWRRTRQSRATAQLETLADILNAYRLEYATYPDGLSDIADRLPPGFDTGTNGIPLDPWKNPYAYEYRTDAPHAYTLYSHGPDGTNVLDSRIHPGR